MQLDLLLNPIFDVVRATRGDTQRMVSGVAAVDTAKRSQLSFVARSGDSGLKWINRSEAGVLLVPADMECLDIDTDAVLVFVDVPRLCFARLVAHHFTPKLAPGIHSTAVIESSATIDPSATVGPYVVIDAGCTIGAGAVIHAHVHLYSGTRVGRNVIINSGSSIGQDGFGYERLSDGTVFKFPHLGGVILEDDVEIGANACVDRGTLADTIVRAGARVDNLVHVAHNCDVGEHTYLISQCHLGGSVKIGRECWISPMGAVRNGASVGDRSMVGMMTLVTKPIGDDVTVAGVPAQPLKDFIRTQKAIKSIAENQC
jgi:UDP-3-O-[3-hydroxymyristoyl] glucosamine N-acyltransferase